MLEVVRTEVDGFGVSTGIWFRTTRAVDASTLPDLKGSVAEGASVFLLSVDPDAPDAGERYLSGALFEGMFDGVERMTA